MTVLIIIGVILSLMLGFALSGLLVISKLQNKNKVIKTLMFLALGSIFSVFVMAVEIFIIWPA